MDVVLVFDVYVCVVVASFFSLGLKRVLNGRKQMTSERMADWAMGEAFAFGSLLMDGKGAMMCPW